MASALFGCDRQARGGVIPWRAPQPPRLPRDVRALVPVLRRQQLSRPGPRLAGSGKAVLGESRAPSLEGDALFMYVHSSATCDAAAKKVRTAEMLCARDAARAWLVLCRLVLRVCSTM